MAQTMFTIPSGEYTLSDAVEELEQQCEQYRERMLALEGELADVRAELREANETIDELDAKVDQFRATLEDAVASA